MKVKTSFKQWQLEKNIADCASSLERLLANRVQTIGLLQLVLPTGWRIGKAENKMRYVERDLQVTQNDIYNIYMTLQHNKVRIYDYYENSINNEFLTIRMNVIVDELDNIKRL